MQFVMLLCNSETEFGVHKKPFWVFSINSGIPPINEPTTGVPMQRALAYIQTTGGEGPVKVKFASPLLKGTEVKFEVGQ